MHCAHHAVKKEVEQQRADGAALQHAALNLNAAPHRVAHHRRTDQLPVHVQRRARARVHANQRRQELAVNALSNERVPQHRVINAAVRILEVYKQQVDHARILLARRRAHRLEQRKDRLLRAATRPESALRPVERAGRLDKLLQSLHQKQAVQLAHHGADAERSIAANHRHGRVLALVVHDQPPNVPRRRDLARVKDRVQHDDDRLAHLLLDVSQRRERPTVHAGARVPDHRQYGEQLVIVKRALHALPRGAVLALDGLATRNRCRALGLGRLLRVWRGHCCRNTRAHTI